MTDNESSYLKTARDVFDVEIQSLQKVRDNLADGFVQAVDRVLAVLGSGGKIVATGIGKNLHIAEKISATLASTGSTSVVLNPSQAMHGDIGIVQKQDVLLVLSCSGESDELLALIPMAKRIGNPIITITAGVDSRLATSSDVVIPLVIEREACPFNMAPTSSTTATLAMGDALAMVLLDAQGFKKEDYAKLHPGGAIGRALLVRVSDIMRSGDEQAVVPGDARIRDALVAMTRARSGSAAVVDNEGSVLGIFTDGDLRRHLAADDMDMNTVITDAMTTSPISVRDDQLAVDVLRIYEEHKIDDLLVVNKDGCLVGAIDIQDLPKVKIL